VQRFEPSSRLVTIGRVKALMVFKSIRDFAPDSVSTWAFSGGTHRVFQHHPAYIPARPPGCHPVNGRPRLHLN
jgi:hypothetical protein